ncbi:MAG: isoprenylcysteine carboxylmethyltransferase family protein [Fibrobacteria bacterium]|nr:isoprenylcysteine carboxylmethyltransferase family protein [Fibrobacteria bacterium]
MTVQLWDTTWSTTPWFWTYLAIVTARNLLEWRTTSGRSSGEPGHRTGGVSLFVFAASYVLSSVSVGIWLLHSTPNPALFVASSLAFSGLHLLRVRVLVGPFGKAWNPYTTPRSDTGLVTSGFHARIRHPLYLLNTLEMAALALILPNPVSTACWSCDLLATLARIPGEERHLAHRFGAQWDDYRARTARLLPGLW